MAFVYILLLRSKNIFQSLKQLEEGTHQAFYNSVLLVSQFFLFFYLCTVYLGTLAGSCQGEGQALQIKMDYCLCRLHNYPQSSSICMFCDNPGWGHHRSSAQQSWSLSAALQGNAACLAGVACLAGTHELLSPLQGLGRRQWGRGLCCLALSLTWTCAPAGVCVPSPALVW